MAASKKLHIDMLEHLEKNGIKEGLNAHKFIDKSTSQSQEKSKQLLSSSLLHAADISTSVRKFDTSKTWADNLFDEFFTQGDAEKAQNISVSFLCDRTTTNIASSQSGFISFVVMPVFKQLSHLAPQMEQVQIAYGERNIQKWKAIKE